MIHGKNCFRNSRWQCWVCSIFRLQIRRGCKNGDFYDAYFAYAEAAKKLGDVAGRKLIWPGAGTRSEWDYDFVQAVFTSTIADYGKNWVNFWENSEDMPELQALQALGGSCANERTFGVIPVK